MKNRALYLILWLILLFAASCSEDDGNTGPIELKERVLNEIITRNYKDGAESKRIEEYFLSGKQYLKYTYEGTTLVAKVEYKYNNRGAIERIKYFYNDVFEQQDDFIYDSEGRIIEFYSENSTAPEMAYYREFEYPGDSTILEQQKDYYKKYFQSIYGKEVNNAALYLSSLLDIPMVYADKFLLTSTWENSSISYQYVLDDEGFPVERVVYYNDLFTSKTTYVYE